MIHSWLSFITGPSINNASKNKKPGNNEDTNAFLMHPAGSVLKNSCKLIGVSDWPNSSSVVVGIPCTKENESKNDEYRRTKVVYENSNIAQTIQDIITKNENNFLSIEVLICCKMSFTGAWAGVSWSYTTLKENFWWQISHWEFLLEYLSHSSRQFWWIYLMEPRQAQGW